MDLLPINERWSLSAAEFHDTYLIPQHPVVLRGAVSHWPAVAKWTPEYLRMHAAVHRIGVLSKCDYGAAGSRRHIEVPIDLPFADVIDVAERDDAPDLSYARQASVWRDIPQLHADIGEIDLNVGSVKDEGFFWLGPAGTVAQLHWDPGRNLVAQIRGSKVWVLVPPEDSHYTYPNKFSIVDALGECGAEKTLAKLRATSTNLSLAQVIDSCFNSVEREMLFHYLGGVNNCEVDAEAPDWERNPLFRNARRYRTAVGPGDLLFVPLGWRHYVRSSNPSISMNWFFHLNRGIPAQLINRTLLEHFVL